MQRKEYTRGETIPGTQYRFVRILGEGGHGIVYAVEHTFLEAPAVMKLLHAELAHEADLAQRMTREARTLAKLRHPNLVEVRDGGITNEEPPRPYFVMEPLTGMSLRDLVGQMSGRGIGVLPALRIIAGVLDGLQHAHAAGVIHRDIKPDNIFLHRTTTDQTVPKVLDFGIAHLLSSRTHLTGRHFLGTPRYAAPEQLKGDPVTVTADIYAVGLVLWELVTGRAPFADKKEIGPLLLAHLSEKLAPASSLAADATPDVDFLLDYLLEKDPARRPPNAISAGVALRELRAHIEKRGRGETDLEATDFKTRPTPIENALVEASPGSISMVTELPRADHFAEPAVAPPPPGRPKGPMMAAHRTVPMGERPGADLPAIDRRSRTRTSPPPVTGAPRHDTEDIAEPRAAIHAGEPSRPHDREESHRPSAVALDFLTSLNFADATSTPQPVWRVSLRERFEGRPVLLFFVALFAFCIVAVPAAVLVAKRIMAPPAETASTDAAAPEVSAIAAGSSPTSSTAGAPPLPLQATSSLALTTSAPSPPAVAAPAASASAISANAARGAAPSTATTSKRPQSGAPPVIRPARPSGGTTSSGATSAPPASGPSPDDMIRTQ